MINAQALDFEEVYKMLLPLFVVLNFEEYWSNPLSWSFTLSFLKGFSLLDIFV